MKLPMLCFFLVLVVLSVFRNHADEQWKTNKLWMDAKLANALRVQSHGSVFGFDFPIYFYVIGATDLRGHTLSINKAGEPVLLQ